MSGRGRKHQNPAAHQIEKKHFNFPLDSVLGYRV
jgi:hypothetical protein